ncbi:DMT family transporter [Bacillus songklensis]|uniref:DMT family transporter n=1 Tax=Bacillus songklensis TaxID=1069116 RepID=A0ABV8AW65_9BACI
MGESLALLAAFTFACANVMVKKGTTSKSVDNGVFLSIVITFLISGIIAVGRGLFQDGMTFTAKGIWWFVLAGLLTAFIGRTLLFTSIQHLGSVRASAIKRLNPFFTVLIGVLFLHESLNIVMIIGMVFIFGSFATLIYESFAAAGKAKKELAVTTETNRQTGRLIKKGIQKNAWIRWIQVFASLGYLFGLISALAYSIGYVVRKEGLAEIPDPYLGTMIGAFAGIIIFLTLSLFQERYRQSIRSAFSGFRPWLFGAGMATSLGQIFYFSALTHSGVSQVALIASMDVIFTLFLSSWVFKTNEGITKTVIFASIIAMMGAGLITIG